MCETFYRFDFSLFSIIQARLQIFGKFAFNYGFFCRSKVVLLIQTMYERGNK